ncbi:unnamed protein product [Cutaneotrichosporon oleaginosum]
MAQEPGFGRTELTSGRCQEQRCSEDDTSSHVAQHAQFRHLVRHVSPSCLPGSDVRVAETTEFWVAGAIPEARGLRPEA